MSTLAQRRPRSGATTAADTRHRSPDAEASLTAGGCLSVAGHGQVGS